MIKLITDLMLIAVVVTFCIEYSGFIDEMNSLLSRTLKCRAKVPKPFSCALCMTFWSGIVYLTITRQFSIPALALACLASWSTVVINEVLSFIRDVLIEMIYKIRKLLRI